VLEGCYGGLIGTKVLGEENGPCLLYGYDCGFVLIFYVFFCKPVHIVEGISFRTCCSDGGVSNAGVGGG
jgi:hypothetical protein